MFCCVWFDQEDTTLFITGVSGIGMDSCFNTYPGSSKAGEDWKDPGTCETTGAVKYKIQIIRKYCTYNVSEKKVW